MNHEGREDHEGKKEAGKREKQKYGSSIFNRLSVLLRVLRDLRGENFFSEICIFE